MKTTFSITFDNDANKDDGSVISFRLTINCSFEKKE